MEYVRFGSTGLKVSPLAFGMAFREQTDEQVAQRVVEKAIDEGINFIDCANTYGSTDDRSFGPGRSERILAKAIKGKRAIQREIRDAILPIPETPRQRASAVYPVSMPISLWKSSIVSTRVRPRVLVR